jgi:RNA polymerase sigma-70 factor, ECF subfamily
VSRRLRNDGEGSLSELISPELIERCKKGDEQAWKQLVEATSRQVYTLCLRILNDPDDAAEATQETFVKVYRNLKTFRGEAQFSTWLYRVASNTAISKHRGRKRRRERESGIDDVGLSEVASPRSTEDEASVRIDTEAVGRALQQLPEHYRVAVVLRDVYGMSMDEIAKKMKISETAAKVRVHRGRKRLKEIVFPDETGAETEELR